MAEDRWLDDFRTALRAGPAAEQAGALAARWAEQGVHLADHEVLGLEFHLGSGRHRRVHFLEFRHKGLLRALGPELRDPLVQAWLETPASGHPDGTGDVDGFLAIIEQRVAAGELPAPARELAHHERAMALAARTEHALTPAADLDSPLALNPSLQVLQFAYDWPTWLLGERDGWPEPAAEPFPMAYVYDPARADARWAVLDGSALAALRIVAESLPVDRVAVQMGLSVEQVRAHLQNAVDSALLVAAGSAG